MTSKFQSFINTVQSFELEWYDFKRGLRNKDKIAFDNLIKYSKKHPQGLKYINPTPFEPFVLSMLLEQEKIIQKLLKYVKTDE